MLPDDKDPFKDYDIPPKDDNEGKKSKEELRNNRDKSKKTAQKKKSAHKNVKVKKNGVGGQAPNGNVNGSVGNGNNTGAGGQASNGNNNSVIQGPPAPQHLSLPNNTQPSLEEIGDANERKANELLANGDFEGYKGFLDNLAQDKGVFEESSIAARAKESFSDLTLTGGLGGFTFFSSRKTKKGKWQTDTGNNYCVEWASIKCNQATHFVKLRQIPNSRNVVGNFKIASTMDIMPVVNVPTDPLWNRCYSLLNPITLYQTTQNFAVTKVWKTIPGPCIFVPFGHWKGECNLFGSSAGNLAVNLLPALIKPFIWESFKIGSYLEAQAMTQDCTLSCMFGGEFQFYDCGQDASPVPYNAVTGLVGPDLGAFLHNVCGVLSNHVGLGGAALLAAMDAIVTTAEDGLDAGITQGLISLAAIGAGAGLAKGLGKIKIKIPPKWTEKINPCKYINPKAFHFVNNLFDGASGLGVRQLAQLGGSALDNRGFIKAIDRGLEKLLFPKLRKQIEAAGNSNASSPRTNSESTEVRQPMNETPGKKMEKARELQGDITNTDGKTVKYENHNKNIDERIKNINNDIDENKSLDHYRQEATTSKGKVEAHERKISNLNHEAKEKKEKMNQNKKDINEKKKRNKQIDDKIEVKRKEKINEIDAEINEKKAAKKKKIKDLEKEVEKKEREKKANEAKLNREKEERNAEIKAKEEVRDEYSKAGDGKSVERVNGEIDKLSKKPYDNQEACDKSVQEKAEIQQQLENEKKEINNPESNYNKEIKDLEDKKQKFKNSDEESMKTLQGYDDLVKEKEGNNEQIANLEKENEDIEKRLGLRPYGDDEQGKKSIPDEIKEEKNSKNAAEKEYETANKQKNLAEEREQLKNKRTRNDIEIGRIRREDDYDNKKSQLEALAPEGSPLKEYLEGRYGIDNALISFLPNFFIQDITKSTLAFGKAGVIIAGEKAGETISETIKGIEELYDKLRNSPIYVPPPDPNIVIE